MFFWAVTKKNLDPTSANLNVNHIHFGKKHEQLRNAVPRLCETEAVGCMKSSHSIRIAEDKRAIQVLESSMRHTGERQEVASMWKDDDITLTSYNGVALRQLKRLCQQFAWDFVYSTRNVNNMHEYINLGIILSVEATNFGTPGRVWYVQNYRVVTASKTNKVRVWVICRVRCRGTLLNNVLLKGPN